MLRPVLPFLAIALFVCGASSAQDLSTSIIGVGKYAPIGGTISPNIAVFNLRSLPADVTLTYTMPAGTTFVSLAVNHGSATCNGPAGANGTIVCHGSSVPAGTYMQFYVVETVDANVVPGTTLTHQASATGTNANGPLQPASSSTSSITASPPSATMSVDYPASAVSGSPFTYHVTVTNTGTVGGRAGFRQTVTDSNASWWADGVTQTSGAPFTCSIVTGVVCSATDFPPGAAATFAITLHTAPNQLAPLPVLNYLSFTDFSSSSASDTHTVNLTQAADERVTIAGNANARVGDDVVYTISAYDDGPTAAGGSLTINLPSGLSFASYAPNYAVAQCTTPPVGSAGTLTCTFPSALWPAIPNYDATVAVVTLHVKPATPGTQTLTASIGNSGVPDPNSANNQASFDTIVTQNGQADLAVAIQANKTTAVVQTENVTFTASVKNNGPSTATNVKVSLSSPGTVVPAPSGCTSAPVVCTVASLAAGQSMQWSWTTALPQTGNNVATISATSDAIDPDPTNNNASATVTARTVTADLAVGVSTEILPMPPGVERMYSVTVSNRGPDMVPQATVTLTLPAESLLLMAGPDCTPQHGNTVTCSFANLKKSDSQPATFAVTRPPSPAVFTFSVAGTAIDPDPTNNTVTSSSAPITPATPGDSDVSIDVASDAIVPVGSTGHFVVTAVNRGPVAASDVTASLFVPLVVSSVVLPEDPNIHCMQYSGLVCVATSLAPGASLSFGVNVTPGFGYEGVKYVTTAVASANHDPDLSNNSIASTVIVGAPALTTSIAPSSASTTVGAQTTHTIAVTNTSSATVDSVTLSEWWNGGLALTAARASSGTCSLLQGDIALSCSIGSVAPGATVNVTVTGTATTPGTWTATAMAGGSSGAGGSAMYKLSTAAAPANLPHHRAAHH